ncbi:MAG TPA: DUF116 domain-containing protein [Anaerolineae bacterium]
MAKIITYSLHGDATTSDGYYRAIATLAEQWMPIAESTMADVCATFRLYRQHRQLAQRTDAEYTFELLVMGVLMREHGREASRWPALPLWVMQRLIKLAGRRPRLEPLTKKLRGQVGQLSRFWASARHGGRQDLPRLIVWLRANGQASQADRLDEWRMFLEPCTNASSREVMDRAQTLAEDFEQVSRSALGQYTQHVELFRAEAAQCYKQRYDAELVTRTRLEYHVGMLGTEVLSRAHRERFQATQRRIVILPPCMRAQPDDQCKAVNTPLGAHCQACTATCRVNLATRLGEKHGFEVYMIPDQLARIGAAGSKAAGGVGMVGVSCALTNWSGGWDADRIGVPAQGVLLDYPGCSYHWDEHGIPTEVNLRQLAAVAARK